MARKLTFKDFLEHAHKAQGDRYTYDHVKYVNTTTKVLVTCPIHGDFLITPKNLFKGRGCPGCNKVVPNTTKTFIEKARKVHGDKYDYSKVKFTRNKDKVTIICSKHGEFVQEANSHLQGHGCPKCFAERLSVEADYPARHAKSVNTNLKRYGVINPMQLKEIREKGYETKRKNGTFATSKQELDLHDRLVKAFGENDVKWHYVSSTRYPWHCDFYIPSRDMFIELNASWTHNNHWYRDDEHDREIINQWQRKNTKYYSRAVLTWKSYDVMKRKVAKKNNLNYVVFWDQYMRDVDMWFDMGMPDGKDYDEEYSWIPNLDLKLEFKMPKKLTPRTTTQVVKEVQYPVFYKREIEMWNDKSALYKEFPLRGFLYMNRYQYLHRVPTDLTAKRMLSSFAISGVHRGFSSFNAKLMLEVIDDIKPNNIYDPFAGWGERALTAFSKGINYYGVDVNKALLHGYNKLESQFNLSENGVQLSINDSRKINPRKKFDISGDYAVITCPPYFDLETYSNSGIENLSYDGFLRAWDTVVQNCNDAKYFCFQINQKFKADMSAVLEKNGFSLVKSLTYENNQASHFQRKNGTNRKKEYEEMLVFIKK